MTQDFVAIGHIDDIPVRGARCLRTRLSARSPCFARRPTRFYAIDDQCPHKGGPLPDGIVHGNAVTCPLHSWVFSLESGKAQGADEGTARTYPLRNIDGALFIALSSLNAAAE